jgi:hypothetical protein
MRGGRRGTEGGEGNFMVVDLFHNEFSKELWMSRESGGGRLFIYQAGVFGAFAGVARTYLYRVI